ncbi:MAG: glycosyltransferase family 2 protein [Firmicutes bacterium]|nr:glycosyltransferase family 2 protein [Bacillota bacterium]
MDKVLVIIPCYNEEKNIARVVDGIRTLGGDLDILVVNDSSTDNSLEIIDSLGVKYLDLSCNLGIGGAVQAGFKYARENGYRYAVQLDGDGQHDPFYIRRMKEQIDSGFNFVVGSRFIANQGFQSTQFRRLGIRYFCRLISLLTGNKVTDATSGYRMADRSVIELFAREYPYDYPEPETLVTLLRSRYRIKEIPVVMNRRAEGRSSISAPRSIYYVVKVTLAMLFCYYRSERVT